MMKLLDLHSKYDIYIQNRIINFDHMGCIIFMQLVNRENVLFVEESGRSALGKVVSDMATINKDTCVVIQDNCCLHKTSCHFPQWQKTFAAWYRGETHGTDENEAGLMVIYKCYVLQQC